MNKTRYKLNKNKLADTIGCLLVGSGIAMLIYYIIQNPERFFTTLK